MLSFSPGCVAAEIIWWYEKDSVIADKGKNIFSETIVHEGWSILRLRFALFFGNFFKKSSPLWQPKIFRCVGLLCIFFLKIIFPRGGNMTSWGWSRGEKNKVWFQGDFKAWKDLFTLVNNWCWFKLFWISTIAESYEIIIAKVFFNLLKIEKKFDT